MRLHNAAILIISTIFILSTIPGTARADCVNPAAPEGTQTYNTTYKTMQFCDGSVWWNMKGGGGTSSLADLSDTEIASPTDGQVIAYDSASGKWLASDGGVSSTMVQGWPDAILCDNSQGEPWLFFNGGESQNNSTVLYHANWYSTGSEVVVFDKTTKQITDDYVTSGGCAVGASVTDLYDNGRAFNFIGGGAGGDGNSGVTSLADLSDVDLAGLQDGQTIVYDGASGLFKSGDGGSGTSATSMVDGWPDAIVCDISDGAWGTTILYATFLNGGGDGRYYYRAIHDTVRKQVYFTADGNYSGADGITTADCINKSISSLDRSLRFPFSSSC